jgi:diamine N-acetyltransferase
MNSEPLFRLASEADADVLLQFMREYYDYDGHGFEETKARDALMRLLRNPNFGKAWLVLDGDKPAGYIVLCFGYSLEWLGRDAFVDELYLREEYRGRGWGRATMTFAEDAARADGIQALHLAVVSGNHAERLYRKLGFHEHTSTFFSKWIAEEFAKPEGRHGY